jgi:hypothetical protein
MTVLSDAASDDPITEELTRPHSLTITTSHISGSARKAPEAVEAIRVVKGRVLGGYTPTSVFMGGWTGHVT